MQISTHKFHAVVTGDIVGSGRLSAERRERLHEVMGECYSVLCEAFPDNFAPSMDIFRGDSWQMFMRDPVRSLRSALFYRALLRAEMESHDFDTRMAIGVGRVASVPEAHVSRGTGEAYRRSGQTLDSMGGDERLRVILPEEVDGRAVAAVVCLLDERSGLWTDRQALAITGMLRGWTQKETAERLWPGGISQQGVSQHLDRAGWNAVSKGLEFVEEELEKIVESMEA